MYDTYKLSDHKMTNVNLVEMSINIIMYIISYAFNK